MNRIFDKLYISGCWELQPGYGTVLKLYENANDRPDLSHLGMEIIDKPAPDGVGFTVAYLVECENIIAEYVDNYSSLVVCCAAGKSRSATVLISYLMVRRQTNFFSAYAAVKSARPQIDPNLELLKILCQRHNMPSVLSSLGGVLL